MGKFVKMKYIYYLLAGSVIFFSACNMLDIKPTGKIIPTTLMEYRALLASTYQTVPDARGLASFRSDEMYVKNDGWELDRYGRKIENGMITVLKGRLLLLNGKLLYGLIHVITIQLNSGILLQKVAKKISTNWSVSVICFVHICISC